ncbi:MAG: hypothetical protein U1F83_15345 [Verrucomicrobiota bacterium]
MKPILSLLTCVAAAIPVVTSAAPVFSDDFSTSTLNSATPAAPTSSSTAYQLFSSKPRVPAPTIATGDLKFGIGATTSGHIEAQGLFTTSPISLATVGDYLELRVTFMNTSGLFAQNGHLGFGLYNSGGVGPLAGGMNGTAVSGTLGVTGGAQGWQGYASRIANNSGTHRIATRPAQSITTGNNQDLLVEGSGSQAYIGAVSLASGASTLSVTTGTLLTENFRITLSGVNTVQIESSLFQGGDTSGALLFSQTASGVTGANFYNGFDALAVGWRATANTAATTIDISSITVNAQIAAVPEPGPLALGALGVVVSALVARRRR